MNSSTCFHCGNKSEKNQVLFDEKVFCCHGCKTVYEILNENDLGVYYELEKSPGSIPSEINDKYNYLDNEKIAAGLFDYYDDTLGVINFYIPNIHCSSCIWILENLNTLNEAVKASRVNFPKKELKVNFDKNGLSLKQLVLLLSSIGYEPYLSLEDTDSRKTRTDRSLIYKLGVAGFAFGNIMLLSFPEYFQSEGFWLEKYTPFFRVLIFLTVLPVVFYAARDYYISAYKGLKNKLLNIDVPIALGISVLFLRSTFEFFINHGQGYFDSLAGFVFFLLLGKYFQQQTYSFLSFERDFKSYFPIAVTKINKDRSEENIAVKELVEGDRLLIRNNELIPVDGVLIRGQGQLDYSFVTGESLPQAKSSGDQLFAGGKQVGAPLEMEVVKTVSQSYLTQLWSNEVFTKSTGKSIKNITDSISKQFTLIVLLIAFLAGISWYFIQPGMVANVVTAVLIIACPCALALSAPFALGNMLRIFGSKKFYLKNAETIERLAKIDTVIFDKTGTITTNQTTIDYSGTPLKKADQEALRSVLRASNHPLSRMLYDHFQDTALVEISNFKEVLGKGIKAEVGGRQVALGNASFVGTDEKASAMTCIYASIDSEILGKYIFKNTYRQGVQVLFINLQKEHQLGVLSGDNEGEMKTLKELLPEKTTYVFNQKPEDKLNYIKKLQEDRRKILMIGDGLNDSGALAQSEVGIVISEDINVFTPASDGIMAASEFEQLPKLISLSKRTMGIIKVSFVLSFLYNIVGMGFAITGNLSPIIAAILMPLSSISIVLFVTLATNIAGRREQL